MIAHDLGSLRLKLQYTSDEVINSKHYDQLLNLVLQSPGVRVRRPSEFKRAQPLSAAALHLISLTVTDFFPFKRRL